MAIVIGIRLLSIDLPLIKFKARFKVGSTVRLLEGKATGGSCPELSLDMHKLFKDEVEREVVGFQAGYTSDHWWVKVNDKTIGPALYDPSWLEPVDELEKLKARYPVGTFVKLGALPANLREGPTVNKEMQSLFNGAASLKVMGCYRTATGLTLDLKAPSGLTWSYAHHWLAGAAIPVVPAKLTPLDPEVVYAAKLTPIKIPATVATIPDAAQATPAPKETGLGAALGLMAATIFGIAAAGKVADKTNKLIVARKQIKAVEKPEPQPCIKGS